MLYFDSITEKYKGNYPFPSDDIPIDDKGLEYHSCYAKAIYSMFANQKAGYWNTEWANKMKQLAAGKQSSDIYKDILLGPTKMVNGTAVREGYMNVDFENLFTVMPKYIKIMMAMLMGVETDLSVSAYDEASDYRRSRKKAELKFKSKFPELVEIAKKIGINEKKEGEVIPESDEEIAVLEDLGYFKLDTEISYEKKVLPFTISESRLYEIKWRFLYDLICWHQSAIGHYWCHESKAYKLKHYDIFNDVFIEETGDVNNRDASWQAVMDVMTIKDIRNDILMSGMEISENALSDIAKDFSGILSNPNLNKWDEYKGQDSKTGRWMYDSYLIPRMTAYWYSIDTHYVKPKNLRTIKGKNVKEKELESRKILKNSFKVIRQCKWIPGSDICYGYGVMNNSYPSCLLPIRMVRVPGKSPVEASEPIIHQIVINFLKLQNLSATASPKGVKIEIGALENISIGGGKLKPMDIIKIGEQSGRWLYRATTANSNYYAYDPVKEWSGGMGDELMQRITLFETQFNQLAEVTGISRYQTASKLPSSDTTATGIQMAANATSEVLKPFTMAFNDVKLDNLVSIINKVQMLVCSGNDIEFTGYYQLLDDEDINAIREAGKSPFVKYNARIIDKIDDGMKMITLQELGKATQVGRNGIPSITSSEYLYLVEQLNNGGAIKYVRRFLALREMKRERQAVEQSQQNIALQNQGLQQNQVLKDEGKMKQIKLEKDLELRNESAISGESHQQNINEMDNEYALEAGLQHAGNLMQQQHNQQSNSIV